MRGSGIEQQDDGKLEISTCELDMTVDGFIGDIPLLRKSAGEVEHGMVG